MSEDVLLREDKEFTIGQVVSLYEANAWSAAQKPEQLYRGLLESHAVVTAWADSRLLGLGNAISDGHLAVYFPHLLVDPEFQKMGIGRKIMERLMKKYAGFHQQMLTADKDAVEFYKKMGFQRAGDTEPMWIYSGAEHG